MSDFVTCDLCDTHPDDTQAMTGVSWRSFGGRMRFHGHIETVKCFEDNSRIKERLATPGQGKVLVVDGGGSLRRALLGDLIAAEAVRQGWEGVILFGACRDVEALATLDIGIFALGAVPLKTDRRGEGQQDLILDIAGLRIKPGDVVYADPNGVIIAPKPLI